MWVSVCGVCSVYINYLDLCVALYTQNCYLLVLQSIVTVERRYKCVCNVLESRCSFFFFVVFVFKLIFNSMSRTQNTKRAMNDGIEKDKTQRHLSFLVSRMPLGPSSSSNQMHPYLELCLELDRKYRSQMMSRRLDIHIRYVVRSAYVFVSEVRNIPLSANYTRYRPIDCRKCLISDTHTHMWARLWEQNKTFNCAQNIYLLLLRNWHRSRATTACPCEWVEATARNVLHSNHQQKCVASSI